ncbi:MAG: leucyl aminopeptidase [Rickettsiales bacterium]|nr:MAG: leucyl aminopeptidase [Rickettsiales bacterium]
MLNISFENQDLYANEAIAVLIDDQLKMDSSAMEIDQKHHGLISKLIEDANKFKGETGQALTLTTSDKEGNLRNLIIVGIGDASKLKAYELEEIGGTIYSQAKACRASSAGVAVGGHIGEFAESEASALLASGALLAAYKFDKYQTKQKDEDKCVTDEFNVVTGDHDAAYKAFEVKKSIAMGVYFARDLVTEVPNVLYPESYAEQIATRLEPIGVDVEVLGEREMHNLGMGAMLGVGQGSARESKLVIMRYNGAADDVKPVCFVGKGVTFDTGGISIKPSANMGDMKYDMGGSASVVGAMKALALRSAKANVIGIVGLVENMPGGNAQRPGDVVTTMSGQTVEILNTDAEGRLVLADCVTYLQEKFDPECVIDLATLTGAITVALASTYAGCFANDEELAKNLIASSVESNEKLWRMPLHKDYDEMIKSPIADMANIGGARGQAGSSTAAHFIGRFIKDGVKWAHLDIAGMAWNSSDKNPICPKGAVGFGVKLLNQFVQDHYESD